MRNQIITETIAIAFIVLFTYAAVTKLMDVQKFVYQIGQSPILTDIAGILAVAIPLIEIVVSIGLIFHRTRLVSLFASLMLMVMFTTYIALMLQFSDHIPCACGGVLSYLGWTEHLIFNMVFSMLAIVGIIYQLKQKRFSHSLV